MGAEQGGGIGPGNEALRAFCFMSHRGGWKWGRGGVCLSSHCLCCCEMLGGDRQGTAGWVLPVSLWCRGMEPWCSACSLARKVGEGEPKEKLQSFLPIHAAAGFICSAASAELALLRSLRSPPCSQMARPLCFSTWPCCFPSILVESSCMMLASPSPGASADLTGEDSALCSHLCLRCSFFCHPLGTSGHRLPPSIETPVLPGASSAASPAPPAMVGCLQGPPEPVAQC